MKHKRTKPLVARGLAQLAALSLLLSLSGLSLATPGLEVLESGPHYSGATYRETVRDLRCELLQEHLGSDTSGLDDVAALGLMREQARKNQLRRERGEPLEGLAFAIDPAKYGS